MPLFTRKPRLPEADVALLDLARKEQVRAFQTISGTTLVATDFRLAVLDAGALAFARPWHAVDTMSWDTDTSTLRISWMDDTTPWAIVVREPDHDLMTTMRARVQSTLVSTQSTSVAGRTVRVVLRKDLRTDELFLQRQYGQGLRAGAPGVDAALARLEAVLRDDAGLPPTWTGEPPLDPAAVG